MGKTIGFTYDLKSDHPPVAGVPPDHFAELDHEATIQEVVEALESGGHKVVRIGNIRNLLSRASELGGIDIVFNICEGMGNRNRESQVPVILDILGIPYVGSDGLTMGLTLDKAMAKKVFLSEGIATPKFFLADEHYDFDNLDSMKFPFIVKPSHEGSSKGVCEDSIVSDRAALERQVKETSRLYRQPALVEEFIRGGEFTVLVIGNKDPQGLMPVQIQITGRLQLGDLIYTSRRLDGDDIVYVCPPKVDEALRRELCDMAVRAYKAVGCLDFGRVDFRVDESGRPYVLELNPLPSLSSADVFPLIAQAEGMTFQGLILKIVDTALERIAQGKDRQN
jgi:D-alanine-D-alanine ligase